MSNGGDWFNAPIFEKLENCRVKAGITFLYSIWNQELYFR